MLKKDTWIQTYLGKKFYPFYPTEDSIEIEDIAHALSNSCRYTGHCKEFYSVSEHSVLVSYILPKNLQLIGLLHDASEAYISDISSPVKQFLEFYKKTEEKIQNKIFQKYNCKFSSLDWSKVMLADLSVLCKEKSILMKNGFDWGLSKTPIADVKIMCLSPREAKEIFLSRFNQLIEERNEDNSL